MTQTSENIRAFITIRGDDRVSFLQGVLTQDVAQLAAQKIQFAAMLSPQGKILHDMFLIDLGDAILIDTQAEYKDVLIKRLMMYKLRAKVTIEEAASHQSLVACLQPLPDPRHAELPHYSPRTTHYPPLTLGIPELGRDFMPDSVVPLDAGYDLLNAISFTKGCYVGQEVTARMHYKHIARRGFFILTNDTLPTRLALLRFDDVYGTDTPPTTHQAPRTVTVDNITYHAALPDWMLPKLAQFQASHENQ